MRGSDESRGSLFSYVDLEGRVAGDHAHERAPLPISPLKKASLTGFHATAKHIAAKAVSPSSETMRTI